MPSHGTALTIGPAPVPHSTLLRPFATCRDLAPPEFPGRPAMISARRRLPRSGWIFELLPGRQDMFQLGYELDPNRQNSRRPARRFRLHRHGYPTQCPGRRPDAWPWRGVARDSARSVAPALADANVIFGAGPGGTPSDRHGLVAVSQTATMPERCPPYQPGCLAAPRALPGGQSREAGRPRPRPRTRASPPAADSPAAVRAVIMTLVGI